MASTTPPGVWSVHIAPLPVSMNSETLANELRLPHSQVHILQTSSNTLYGCINDFANAEDAMDFVIKWSGAVICGQTIRCTATADFSGHSSADAFRPTSNQMRRSDLFIESKAPRHDDGAQQRSRYDEGVEAGDRYESSSSASTHANEVASRLCLNCFDVDCELKHPNGWNPCIDGDGCDDFECTADHAANRKRKCRQGRACRANQCEWLHPRARVKHCRRGVNCKLWHCAELHPRGRAERCLDKENCTNLDCWSLHPPERAQLLCALGALCRDLACRRNHPGERSFTCDPRDHADRMAKKYLKTIEQRTHDRQKNRLPILAYRKQFCERLEREHVLVVTAETGSGKSTQLPQYAAEHFGSLVVCTQPRVVAALSLARRVADEYDGGSVGESVGFLIGNGNEVRGSDIIFMTDTALIRQSQRHPSLKHIRTLIIDEAHERSLNTDIVLGLAKLLLAQRPDDFYVVVASATIDPGRFLQFFDRPTCLPLAVKGRVFPVKEENKPPAKNCADEQLIAAHLIPTLIELYPRHSGHTLVFLPGQNEIERALKIFQSKLPDDCVALPLYGSQSPEEQEKVMKFDEPHRRMVVFCTNVAETSLTIPNVRLVIDSGWAKEARYDAQRRLTVIETVRISRSSADQRRGRAGRTAPGHCVRLYADSELNRAHIEPEILRSSLDLVLLQLIRLGFDSRTFPFIDQPPHDTIVSSLELLAKLQCVHGQKISQRGELFTELALDPRLSAFIVDVYTEHESLLDRVVTIVAILSAPGTVFFLGGTTPEAKQEAKARVALEAHNYQSDLFHLYSVYDRWRNASGQVKHGKCSTCNKLAKYCACRARHSSENCLNNRILHHIDGSCASILEQIRRTHWLRPGRGPTDDAVSVIGRHLGRLFPEQCGYLLVPAFPIEGVRLVSTDIRASISNTSVFMQKLHHDRHCDLYQHFAAMTITQLPSGQYIVEKLHPILKSHAVVPSCMNNLLTLENIGFELGVQLRRMLSIFRAELWAKWLVFHYDRSQCRFDIWGMRGDKAIIVPIVRACQAKALQKLLDAYELLECGPVKANFQSGLICTHINKMADALKIHLANVPSDVNNALKSWVRNVIGIEWDEIRAHGTYDTQPDAEGNRSKRTFLVFKSEETFRRAVRRIPAFHMPVHRSASERDNWGRELIIETLSNVTADGLVQRYGGADLVIRCVQLKKPSDDVSSLKLNNLPVATDAAVLRRCLQQCNGPTPKEMFVTPTKNNATAWGKATFHNDTQRDEAAAIFREQLCQTDFPILIYDNYGPKEKFVRTNVVTNDDPRSRHNQLSAMRSVFLVTLVNREAALRVFSSLPRTIPTTSFLPHQPIQWAVDSSATSTIRRTDLYPDFDETLDGICQRFDVNVKCKGITDFHIRCTFNGGTPQTTGLAASLLAQTFAPIIMRLNTERQKQLFQELEDIGLLQQWTDELGLAISSNKFRTTIEIRGPQLYQGQLMRRIANYSDRFDGRFREVELSATVAAFFGPQNAASGQLQEIHSRWSTKSCSVSFNRRRATIAIVGKPDVSAEDMQNCEGEVRRLLNEIVAHTNDDDDGVLRRCVFCDQQSLISTSVFRICGHGFCRCAAQALATSHTFPLRCKVCQANIHIRDIRLIFSNNERLLRSLLKSSVQHYLTGNHQQENRVFCPNGQCDGLISLDRDYQTCLTCGKNVCSQCRAIDDELHSTRTCAEVIEEKKHSPFLNKLFTAARQFVNDHWPIDATMHPIGRIDENPYLRTEYESYSRFCQGSQILGHTSTPDLAKGFFAYHGSSTDAIGPICQTGFDPKRRTGQVYGRGEYFGTTALISHGYCRNGGISQTMSYQMIIAFILRCTHVTTNENFCFIVDNPVSWTYAFNLPVLVVTYGPKAIGQPYPFPVNIPFFYRKPQVELTAHVPPPVMPSPPPRPPPPPPPVQPPTSTRQDSTSRNKSKQDTCVLL